jgi:hypothetical protein
MYNKKHVTPYLHALLVHTPAMLQSCMDMSIPLRYFSCESLEKKNHLQVRLFFCKTRKDGGRDFSSAIKEILEVENRSLYFSHQYRTEEMREIGRVIHHKKVQ